MQTVSRINNFTVVYSIFTVCANKWNIYKTNVNVYDILGCCKLKKQKHFMKIICTNSSEGFWNQGSYGEIFAMENKGPRA